MMVVIAGNPGDMHGKVFSIMKSTLKGKVKLVS